MSRRAMLARVYQLRWIDRTGVNRSKKPVSGVMDTWGMYLQYAGKPCAYGAPLTDIDIYG